MPLKPPVSGQDHIQGSGDALIELVEYGDYQCPYCRAAYPIIKAIQKKFGKDLKFIYRNFPYENIHHDAFKAAMAAEAAGVQGKYWEMHDIIFENQDNLTTKALVKYARRIGLDVPIFESDMNNNTLEKKIDADFESGVRSGVNRTPSFYINGEKYEGEWDEATLSGYIREKLDLLLQRWQKV
jgi:protein-disulfide isomerase